jgi:tRNA nucleotidyltransferase/poly(A) polymerase
VPDAILTLNEPVLRSIGRIADRDGVRAYAVGGYVRDLLLGRDVKDIDITVIGNGIAFARSVARELGVQAPVCSKPSARP